MAEQKHYLLYHEELSFAKDLSPKFGESLFSKHDRGVVLLYTTLIWLLKTFVVFYCIILLFFKFW